MVERLKVAIAKAREKRQGDEPDPRPARVQRTAREDVSALWETLPTFDVSPELLQRERVVTFNKSDTAHVAFDMLRTRLLKLALENGWRRIGITSPTKGCGKTVVSANLGFSFGRHPETKTILLDMDLRSPRLSKVLGVRERRSISWLLNGSVEPENYLLQINPRFAVALNSQRLRDSSEVIQNSSTATSLKHMISRFQPDIILYDLPPLLVGDETTAFLANLDAAMLVIGAGETTPKEIEDSEELLTDNTNFLGIVLNKVDRASSSSYYYGYGYGYGSEQGDD